MNVDLLSVECIIKNLFFEHSWICCPNYGNKYTCLDRPLVVIGRALSGLRGLEGCQTKENAQEASTNVNAILQGYNIH